ncbi:MAG: mechanosensitive ion channel domain-containing protein [Saprospiraceae bacterium]
MPNFVQIFQELLSQFASAMGRFVGAALVFLIGYIIAKIAYRVVKKLLMKIGVDQIGDKLNEIDFISKSNVKIKISEILAKVLYYILLLLFTLAATEVLAMEAISNLVVDIINYIPSLLSAAIVLVIGILIADFVKNIVAATCKSLNIPAGSFIASFVFYFLFLSIGMSALSQAQFDTGFITQNLSIILIGIVTAFAIGYGFASRDLMANFIASFYSKNKVKVGDKIGIEGQVGTITAIDSNAITLQAEGKKVLVPLSKLTTEKIEIFE